MSTCEYLLVRIFILNKALGSFETKLWGLGEKFKKTIVEYKISNLEYSIVSSFILNKALSSFGTKFAQEKYFGDEI